MEERRLVIPGRYERIKDVCEFVAAAARDAGLDDKAEFHCQTAVDEACTNIIEHGYEGEDKGSIEVICKLVTNGELTIELRDRARPFDPSTIPEPPFGLTIEDMDIGGFGIYFILKMMDHVQYQNVDGTNVLRLTRRSRTE